VRTNRARAADRPPSVAFVSSYGGSGGSEIYLERLLGKLDRSRVHSVITLGEGALIERLRALEPTVEVVSTSGDLRSIAQAARRVRRLLRVRRPDVVHANGLKAAIVTVLATTGTRLPVVWIRHDFSMEGWRARMLARGCRRVICVSHALARTFRGPLQRKVHVVHTGIPDIEVERDEARQHLKDLIADPRADPVVSLVGHLVPGKGHLDLIEVTPALLEQVPHARILFVGDVPADRFTPYRDQLKDHVKQLGVLEATTFLGHRPDAMTVIAGSDVVVMPSGSRHRGIETEGFPLLALEALAAGTPVVAYAVGGLPELVAECGALVPPTDRDGLLDAIVRVTTDPALWERMSTCGRVRARTSFSSTAMIAGLERVYRLAERR
jgi:glycosyltransferase involved in cell wall biosynthesis